eukprot:Phypoly_transcript_02704.p1 GENE.Phypoly_transcript_02704~~Phypoly_transcript_02704.p1  ORF type:complete len:678 (+),score=140.60 Phypoly_transcript_02704:127-2160(+)
MSSSVPQPGVHTSPTLHQIVHSSPSPSGSPSIDKTKANNKARKPRKRWTGQQLEKLEGLFKINQNPKAEDIDQLANETQSQSQDVRNWFQNRRAKEKKRGSPSGEVDITTIDTTKVTMHNVENGNTIPSPHLQTLTHTTIEHNIEHQHQPQHHQSPHPHHQHLPSHPAQHQLQSPSQLPPPQHHSQHHPHSHQLPHLPPPPHQLQHAPPLHQSHQAMQHHPHQHQLQGSPQQPPPQHLSPSTHAHSQHLSPSPSQVIHPPPHQAMHNPAMQHQGMPPSQAHLQQDTLEACPSCAPYIDKLNQRIKELEDQCHQFQLQLFNGSVPGPPPPIPSISSPKRERDLASGELLDESADKKLKKSLEPQRLFKKWANQVTRKIKGAKFFEAFGVPTAPVVIEEACTKEMFDACFETKGRLIQPTPDNKPYSTVTIRRYEGFEEVHDLFGDGNIVHGGHPAWVWRRNTVNTRSGEPRDVKLHRRTASIDSLEVHYNRNTMRLQLTFTCTLTPDNIPPKTILPNFHGQPGEHHIPNTLPLPHSRLGLNFLPPSLRSLAPNLNSPARVQVEIDRTLITSISDSMRMSHGEPHDPHASNLNPIHAHNNLQTSLPNTLQNSHPLPTHSLSHTLPHNSTLHSSLQNLPPNHHMQNGLQSNLQNALPHSMQTLNMPNMNSLSPHLSSSTM